MSTPSLFEIDKSMVKTQGPVAIFSGVDVEAVARYAFCYTATEKGNATGVRFMATMDDARRWCDSPLSKGIANFGVAWAYFFTGVLTYLENRTGWIPAHGGTPIVQLELDPAADNGQWDERIASAGCHKIGITEIASVLGPLGVKVEVTT